MAELTVDDFSGGLTDNYVGAPKNKFQKADNFNIEYHTDKAKLLSRYGSEIYDENNARADITGNRVSAIKSFDGSIIKFVNRSLYQYDATKGWVELKGPSGNSLYPSTTTTSNVVSYSQWSRHLMITNDDLSSYPSKIYISRAESGTPTRSTNTLTLSGHQLTDNMLVTYTTSATAIGGLTSGTKYYVISSAVNTFQLSLTQGGSAITLSGVPAGTHVFTPVTFMLRTAGMPALASTPTGVHGTAGTAKSYYYKFVYYYTYTNDTIVFEDFGPAKQTALIQGNTDIAAGAGNTVTISGIPEILNGSTLNYDTARIKVKIYRTTNAGAVFYYVGEVTNGTTSYADTTTDATLQLSSLLYTEGGVLDNDPPVPCKVIHVSNSNTSFFAHYKDGTEVIKNGFLQSVPGDIDSSPLDNATELDDEIVGFSSVKNFGIALCKNSTFRVEGTYDLLGRGGSAPYKISDTCSCVSAQSVVQTLEGVFWAGIDAFYYTDGYNVIKINEDWPTTYNLFANTDSKKSKIQGKYDSFNRRIVWTVFEGDSSADNDKCYVLHLKSGVSNNSAFTTYSNDGYFYPTAIEFDGSVMYRGDKRGYLLAHRNTLYSDPKIDTSVAASAWSGVYIPYDDRSSAMDFGQLLQRKYATSFILTCKNKSNLSVQVKSNNDDNRKISNLKPIRFRGNIIWGDPNIVWGDPDLIWNFDGLIENRRWFPQTSLRFSYKQIQIENAYVAIYNSDSLGLVNIDSTTKTVTLVDGATIDWPTDILDYYIAFESDGYVKEYLITERTTADVLTYQDALNSSVTGSSQKWIIRGYPKGEIINILSYTIGYIVFGDTQNSYVAAEGGEVGSSSADS